MSKSQKQIVGELYQVKYALVKLRTEKIKVPKVNYRVSDFKAREREHVTEL